MPTPIPHPWIDSSRAPLYVWTLRDATSDEVRECLIAREKWAEATAEPVAWVVDLTHLTRAPPVHRKLFAGHLERFREFDERWTAGTAIVASNAWLRGLVTAVFWLTPAKFPHQVFAEVGAAGAWAAKTLKQKLPSREGIRG